MAIKHIFKVNIAYCEYGNFKHNLPLFGVCEYRLKYRQNSGKRLKVVAYSNSTPATTGPLVDLTHAWYRITCALHLHVGAWLMRQQCLALRIYDYFIQRSEQFLNGWQ